MENREKVSLKEEVMSEIWLNNGEEITIYHDTENNTFTINSKPIIHSTDFNTEKNKSESLKKLLYTIRLNFLMNKLIEEFDKVYKDNYEYDNMTDDERNKIDIELTKLFGSNYKEHIQTFKEKCFIQNK